MILVTLGTQDKTFPRLLEAIQKQIDKGNIKDKDKILKATREKKQVTYKGNPICLTADLSAETLQARREL